jgi:pyruvate,orthophosphate dikinase
VVSRALGRPCVVGVGDGAVARAGETVTVDGGAGLVYAGALATEIPRERDHGRLAQLIAWARAASPVAVLLPEEADGLAAVDIDAAIAAGGLDQLAPALAGAKAARGSALATPDVARAARDQGVTTIITDPILPALLTMIEAAP